MIHTFFGIPLWLTEVDRFLSQLACINGGFNCNQVSFVMARNEHTIPTHPHMTLIDVMALTNPETYECKWCMHNMCIHSQQKLETNAGTDRARIIRLNGLINGIPVFQYTGTV